MHRKEPGYDAHRAWSEIKRADWERANPVPWYAGLLAIGGAVVIPLMLVTAFALLALGISGAL